MSTHFDNYFKHKNILFLTFYKWLANWFIWEKFCAPLYAQALKPHSLRYLNNHQMWANVEKATAELKISCYQKLGVFFKKNRKSHFWHYMWSHNVGPCKPFPKGTQRRPDEWNSWVLKEHANASLWKINIKSQNL